MHVLFLNHDMLWLKHLLYILWWPLINDYFRLYKKYSLQSIFVLISCSIVFDMICRYDTISARHCLSPLWSGSLYTSLCVIHTSSYYTYIYPYPICTAPFTHTRLFQAVLIVFDDIVILFTTYGYSPWMLMSNHISNRWSYFLASLPKIVLWIGAVLARLNLMKLIACIKSSQYMTLMCKLYISNQ